MHVRTEWKAGSGAEVVSQSKYGYATAMRASWSERTTTSNADISWTSPDRRRLAAIPPATQVWCQRTKSPPTSVQTGDAKDPGFRTGLLRQFSAALEDLVAKVSPAVVQVQASGLGPVEGKNGSP